MGESRDDIVGRLAIQQGRITSEQLAEAREVQRKAAELGLPETLGHVLVAKGMLSEEVADELVAAAAVRTGEARVIGGYEIVQKLGQGGMGSVYKARHAQSGMFVALKILPPSLANETMIARFKREAAMASRLNHPNIVRYVEFGFDRERGMYYCALEYVDGEDVAAILKRRHAIDEPEAVTWAYQIADALDHAYKNGLVHRDIKPENIMIMPDGTAKLLDLGLARHTVETGAQLTQEGHFVGSPLYTSPEQARGVTDVDIRADIYSLGVTMYTMVTGDPPFYHDNSMKVLQMHISERAPWLADINPELSEGLCRVVAKMMNKEPDDRYEMPKDVLEDLALLARGETPLVTSAEIEGSSVGPPRGRKVDRKPTRVKGTTKATRVGPRSKTRAGVLRTGAKLRPVKGGAPGKAPAGRTIAISGAIGGVAAVALLLMLAGGGEEERPNKPARPSTPGVGPVKVPAPHEARPAPARGGATRAGTAASALRSARAFEEENPHDLRGARAQFESVGRDFPGTPEAGLAQMSVARLDSRLNPAPTGTPSTGEELIRNGGFELRGDDGTPVEWARTWNRGSSQWVGGPGGRWLRVIPGGAVEQRLALDPAWTSLRVSCRLRGEGIEPGKESWSLPRVNLGFYARPGDQHTYRVGPLLKTDAEWSRRETTCTIPEGARHVQVVVCNQGSAGIAEFDDISVRVPHESGPPRSTRREKVIWSADFENGLPAGWGSGVAVSSGLPPGSRGGVKSAGGGIQSESDAIPGFFTTARTNVFRYTFRAGQPGWHHVLLCCRHPTDHSNYVNILCKGPHMAGLGDWTTASLPLTGFTTTQGARLPDDWVVTRIVWSAERGRDVGLTIDRAWVTADGRDDSIREFRGRFYEIVLRETTWPDAERRCVERGGHLACIADEAENAFVAGMARAVNRAAWIGLTRDDARSRWRWVSGEPVTFTDWAPGEPSNSDEIEFCVHVSTYARHEFRWNDSSGSRAFAFVCEWDRRPGSDGRVAGPAAAARPAEASPAKDDAATDGLVGWWKLDETSGRVAHDSSGNGNDGELRGNPVWRPGAGRIGGALAFDPSDGTNDYVELPVSATLRRVPPASLTVAAWCKFDAYAPVQEGEDGSRYSVMVRQGRHCGAFVDERGKYCGEFWTGDVRSVVPYSGTPVEPGGFHHVAFVVDMAGGVAKIYVDGHVRGRKSFDAALGPLDYRDAPWRIGCSSPEYPRYNWPMNGLIDDVRLYERALSSEEIRRLSLAP